MDKVTSITLKCLLSLLPEPIPTLITECTDAIVDNFTDNCVFPEMRDVLADEDGIVRAGVYDIISDIGPQVFSPKDSSHIIDRYLESKKIYNDSEINVIKQGVLKYSYAVSDWANKNKSALVAAITRCGIDIAAHEKTIHNIQFSLGIFEDKLNHQEMKLNNHDARIETIESHLALQAETRDLSAEYRRCWTDNMFLNPNGSEHPLSLESLYDGIDGYLMPSAKYKKSGVYRKPDKLESEKLKTLLLSGLDAYSKENDDNKNLVILGLPGIGKSTLVTWFCNAYQNSREIIAYSLAALFSGENRFEKNTILSNIGIKESELSDKILILDGLDEVIKIENKGKFIKNLFYDLRHVKGLSIIITCRVNYISPDELIKSPFPYAVLSPWSATQIRAFAERYCEKTKISLQEKTITNLCKDEKAELYGIPLIAYMVIATKTEVSDSMSETDIFDRLFSLHGGILDHQIDYQDISRPRPLDYNTKLKILDSSRKMAFWIFENNPSQADIEVSELSRILGIGDTVDSISTDFFKQMRHIEGKLRIQFAHRTFYEYFVADYLCDMLIKILPEEGASFELGHPEELAKVLAHFSKRGEIDYSFSSQIKEFIKAKLISVFKERNYIVNNILSEECYFWFEEGVVELFDKGMTSYAYQIDGGRDSSHPLDAEMMCCKNCLQLLSLVYSLYRNNDNDSKMLYHSESKIGKIAVYLRALSTVKMCRFDLCYADLRNADLLYTILRYADLRHSTLIHTNLYRANLGHADLSYAELNNAILHKSSLREARLSNSILCEADLREADLRYATLDGADLRGANLDCAHISSSCATSLAESLVQSRFETIFIDNNKYSRYEFVHNFYK